VTWEAFVALRILLALVVVLAFAPTAQASADDGLLSRGTPATASSELRRATLAVDDDPKTYWRSGRDDRQWIATDLGSLSTITKVAVRWTALCAKEYQVQTSPDGVSWRALTSPGFGRFVRVYASKPCLAHQGYGLTDFEVYGHPGVVDVVPPGAPSGLFSNRQTATSVTLTWTAAQDNVVIGGYDVYQSGQLVKSVDGNTLSTTVNGLKQLTEYSFYVNARDGAGNVSQGSNTATVWTPPAVVDGEPPTTPTNVQSTATTANSVSLAWTPSVDNVAVTGYSVFSGGKQVVTTGTNSATVTGLAAETATAFTVRALDAGGRTSPFSEPVTVTTKRGHDPVGQVTTVTTDTDVPWGLVFESEHTALYAQRDTGDIVRVTEGGDKVVVGRVPDVTSTDGEGGLLGLELRGGWVYVFHTTLTDNRIVRIRLKDGKLDLTTHQVLVSGLARNKFHNGGRLRFGPDGKLYAATGDAQSGPNAQNLNSLNGKVLRLNPDGSVPADNPFPGKYVWSYGHRNVQGLAFDSRGRLWEAELGNSVMDEVNLIQKGGNYGWPACEGTSGACDEPTFIKPKQTWPVADASPSGLAIVGDTLYLAALRAQKLYRMKITGDALAAPQPYFQGAYGRLRTVEPTPCGDLWLTTSNGDKDSVPNNSTTQIMRVDLR
jgi:glucose/arabinose dehydrogenase